MFSLKQLMIFLMTNRVSLAIILIPLSYFSFIFNILEPFAAVFLVTALKMY